jgi:hypothetical protein
MPLKSSEELNPVSLIRLKLVQDVCEVSVGQPRAHKMAGLLTGGKMEPRTPNARLTRCFCFLQRIDRQTDRKSLSKQVHDATRCSHQHSVTFNGDHNFSLQPSAQVFAPDTFLRVCVHSTDIVDCDACSKWPYESNENKVKQKRITYDSRLKTCHMIVRLSSAFLKLVLGCL